MPAQKLDDAIVDDVFVDERDNAYLWWSLCTLYLHVCQVRVAVGDSGLCCACVTSFER